VQIQILCGSGKFATAGFNLRKSWRECLIEARKYFEVVAFTASVKNYGEAILNYLDPENELFDHRFYRDSCVYYNSTYVKDLRIFEGEKMEDLILVDNAVYSMSFQLDNGIPIIPFYDDKEDDQLEKLMSFMPILHKEKDVRNKIRKYF